MLYRPLGKTGVSVSAIALGGHEFGPGGHIRGFGDDHVKAVTRGYIFPGFGGENRRELVHRALDRGINLFDLTIDSEKEAMGRILRDADPAGEILLQTRPEGMVYTYDPANRQMADYRALREEVVRICKLIGRDRVDILNFAFMRAALDADPEYLDRIGDNIRRLKREGLIRFASADTFSGEAVYLAQYRAGHFDTTFINCNPGEEAIFDRVIPEADALGIGVLCRETFMKGALFRMAEEAGYTDRAAVARAALRWVLSHPSVASVAVGVATPDQLEANCRTAEAPALTEEDGAILDAIRGTEAFQSRLAKRSAAFRG